MHSNPRCHGQGATASAWQPMRRQHEGSSKPHCSACSQIICKNWDCHTQSQPSAVGPCLRWPADNYQRSQQHACCRVCRMAPCAGSRGVPCFSVVSPVSGCSRRLTLHKGLHPTGMHKRPACREAFFHAARPQPWPRCCVSVCWAALNCCSRVPCCRHSKVLQALHNCSLLAACQAFASAAGICMASRLSCPALSCSCRPHIHPDCLLLLSAPAAIADSPGLTDCCLIATADSLLSSVP